MDRAVYVTLKQRHQRQMTEDKRRAVSQVPMLAVLSQVYCVLHAIVMVPLILQYLCCLLSGASSDAALQNLASSNALSNNHRC